MDNQGVVLRFQTSHFSHSVQAGSVAHTALYSVGTGAFSAGVKMPGHASDHISTQWEVLCLQSSIRLHEVHRDNFTISKSNLPLFTLY
jgi:hypothetical protein